MAVAEIPAEREGKTGELRCHLCDSTIWDRVPLREGDIVIASWAKSATTWTQQIVGQLLFDGAEEVDVAALSPWVDFRVGVEERIAVLEAQRHRRFLKTHLPVEALGLSPKAKYVYLARDGRDVMWSYHNHFTTLKEDRLAAINNVPGRVGPPMMRPPASRRAWFRDWLEGDGFPFWPFWSHVRGWWEVRDRPNVKLLHFNRLKRDLEGSVRELAAFLDIPLREERLPAILEHCSFDWMKGHAALVTPGRGLGFEDGVKAFLHSGTNGRWQQELTAEDCADYEARALEELGPDCARWLATGEGA